VNLIPYNPIAEEDFRRPSPEAVEAFRRLLGARHVAVSVRASRGPDADAACGQLRRRLETPPAPGRQVDHKGGWPSSTQRSNDAS
jgi:23S rRNA (adenine2503-C2)-methyltransferase